MSETVQYGDLANRRFINLNGGRISIGEIGLHIGELLHFDTSYARVIYMGGAK